MADTSIQPNTGQLVLRRGQAIPTPLRASLEITGAAPSLIQGTVIIPGTGSLEFGELGGPTPGTGALAMIGPTPTGLRATFLTPAAGGGAGAGAGRAPGGVVGSLFVPGVGSLVLAEGSPSPVSGTLRTPAAGSLIVSGVAPILQVDTRLTVAPGG